MERRLFIAGIFVLGQLLLPAAAADGVAYRWVDENGVTHFSDAPPPAESAPQGGVESITLAQDYPAPADPAADYYSIANQWRRLREERAERNALALQQQMLRLERSRIEQSAGETAPAEPDSGRSAVVIYGGAPRFPRAPNGQRVFHNMQPVFYHNLRGDDYVPHRSAIDHRQLPSYHSLGDDQPHQRSVGTKFKCC